MRSLLVATIVLLLATAATARTTPRWNELEGYTFQRYVEEFGRSYSAEEYKMREAVFNENLEEIRMHNGDSTQSYKKGINHFADWTMDEKRAYNTARPKNYKKPKPTSMFKSKMLKKDLPKEVDWRTKNPPVISAVKNQGACGNCWAHSAIESVESFFALKFSQLPILSQQQVTSCTTLCDGCGGGLYENAWLQFEFSNGIYEEWEYPFTDFFSKNMATSSCEKISDKFSKNFWWYPKAGVTGYQGVTQNDAGDLVEALATDGPQSITVAASLWFNYEGGIYENNTTDPSANWELDHAVQVVGYGHDSELGKDYWTVRNSWGTTWGEDGYIRLSRPATEPCGVYNFFEKVCGTCGILYQPARAQVKELSNLNP